MKVPRHGRRRRPDEAFLAARAAGAQAQENLAKAVAKARAYRFAVWEFNVGVRRLRNLQGALVELSNGDFNLLAAFVLGAAAHAAARAAAAVVVTPERRRGLRPHDRRADLATAQMDRTRNRSQPTLIVTRAAPAICSTPASTPSNERSPRRLGIAAGRHGSRILRVHR
jgi:hypothetical protein